MDDDNYRVKQWTPPARPEWVQRVNEEGRYLDIRSVVPLDADSLISHAKGNTGLEDFGGDGWYERFQVFIKSLEEESDLNLMGRIMTRSDLLMYLEARLRIEDTYKKHPEIEEQELAPPMLIVGSGRSGTSAMQNLLALDPDNGTTTSWEALFPCPPPEAATYRTDPRIAIADKRLTQWERVTPEMATVHEWGGTMPTELIHLEGVAFSSAWLIFCGFTPSFDAYQAKEGMGAGLRYAKRILKLLQWKNPRKRWLLKSPYDMNYLPTLFEVFPDMQLIWMHRDPLKTVSSAVNLTGTILWMRSDQPLSDAVFEHMNNPAGLAHHFNAILDQIEQGTVPGDRFHHVQYVDFIDDAVATVEKLYREMGIEFTPAARAAMESYVRQHPREARPAHRYSVGDEARRAEERKLFQRYQDHFKVKLEL